MGEVIHKIAELEQSKAFLEDAERALNATLAVLREQGKQSTQGYRKQQKLYLKTIKTLLDIKRFLDRWDRLRLKHASM